MNDSIPGTADGPPRQEHPAPAGPAPQDPPREAAEPGAPAPLGVPRPPTGHAGVDARLERLADVDHLPADGHLEVYEDVHRGLRDALTALDARGPAGPGPHGPQHDDPQYDDPQYDDPHDNRS
ncbi:hypothetical protein ABT160_19540 [Streptomyces sp. NPDC001941]|uniref:hypothetical protein n=1 Tax=Streptomyces sp. NPDC001941 TaxID=3154659 RepID=UPI0033325F80